VINATNTDVYGVFTKWGGCLTAEATPRVTFGFIHGMWALDNSRWIPGYPQYCGVNHELSLLRQLNCYADFTFPAWSTMEPPVENIIFYARDDDAWGSYKNPRTHAWFRWASRRSAI